MPLERLRCVLIVDDDIDFASDLAAEFRRHTTDIRTATTSDEAWAAMHAGSVDLVVLDLCLLRDGLPNGFDLIRDFKRQFPETRVAVVTGYWSVATCETALLLGADAYLAKPATADGILSRLKKPVRVPRDQPSRFPTLASAQWEHIQRALVERGGNISAAARLLGINRRSLVRKLHKRPPKS